MRFARSPHLPRRGPAALVALALALILALMAILTACGSDDPGDVEDVSRPSVDVDPVTIDDGGRLDGRSADNIPWAEVGPGWTLVVHEPAPVEEARTAGIYLIDPLGRRYLAAEIDLGEDYVLAIEDWLADRRGALLTRSHLPGIDDNPEPSVLELLDLESGERRELKSLIPAGQVNVASYSRPTGKVILFADGVGGALERRSPEWERLSTVADEAFAWTHSPDGALVAVGTLPSSAPSRLTINANDSGEELLDLPLPADYRFCHPKEWWDSTTLLASCGNTGVVEPKAMWLFPTDGSDPEPLKIDGAVSATDAVRLPDGRWVALGVDNGLWAIDDGARLTELSEGSTIVGASSVGVVIVVDGELRVVDLADGASATLLPRDPGTVGVTAAATLTSASFTAEWPPDDASTAEPTTPPTAPDPGQVLIVAGVAGDDVLHFRVEPDPGADVVADVAPVAEGPPAAIVVTTGEATRTGTSVWWQVTVDGETAWANSRFLGVEGPTGPLPDDMADLEVIGPDADFVAVISVSRPPADATGALIDAYGVDSISSIFVFDVMGSFGNGVKGERYVIEAWNIKEIVDDDVKFIGSKVMQGQRTEICAIGLDDSGQCR